MPNRVNYLQPIKKLESSEIVIINPFNNIFHHTSYKHFVTVFEEFLDYNRS